MSRLSNLTTLSLSANNLAAVPPWIGAMRSLTALSIGCTATLFSSVGGKRDWGGEGGGGDGGLQNARASLVTTFANRLPPFCQRPWAGTRSPRSRRRCVFSRTWHCLTSPCCRSAWVATSSRFDTKAVRNLVFFFFFFFFARSRNDQQKNFPPIANFFVYPRSRVSGLRFHVCHFKRIPSVRAP